MKRHRLWLSLFPILLLCSCLPVNHHLYTGAVLQRGQQEHAWAVGQNHYYKVQEVNQTNANTLSSTSSCMDSLRCRLDWVNFPSLSKAWRIGAFDSVGIFPGLEFGYTLEIPMTLGFGVRLGLPSPKSKIKHALGLGWDLGTWVDNTLWTEHAVSYFPREAWGFTVLNRVQLLGTSFGDLNPNADFLDQSHRTLRMQTVLGTSIEFGKKRGFLPNVLHLQVSNEWRAMGMLGSKSASAVGMSEPWVFKPSLIGGFTWY